MRSAGRWPECRVDLETTSLPVVLLGAVLLALGARVVWVASRSETGWDVLRVQWYDATLGWLAGEYEPIGQREPPEQADFWLAETDRILAAHPDGAVWMEDVRQEVRLEIAAGQVAE